MNRKDTLPILEPILQLLEDRVIGFESPNSGKMHAQELAAQPAGWTPWNYRETLTRAGVS